MKYRVAGNQIICSRRNDTDKDKNPYRKIVDFDAHLETVPPHVAARLTPVEIKQLEEFLADRKRIQANPIKQNMLEALPGLLQEATEALGSATKLDRALHKQLSESVTGFSEALDKVKPVSSGRLTLLKRMHKSQAQKNGSKT